MDLSLVIESIIFASEQPVKVRELQECLEKNGQEGITEEEIESLLSDLIKKYEGGPFSFGIIKSGDGYQFSTHSDYHEVISSLLSHRARKRLTSAAMETLAIIAYKQPVPKSEIERIRGVNSDYTVQKLMEKELVEIVGRSNDPGRPLLYGTSEFFFDYFGINGKEDLPKLKEFEVNENEIGLPETLERDEGEEDR